MLPKGEKLQLLTPEDCPEWFVYPQPFLRLVERGIVYLDPWWIVDRSFLIEKIQGLKSRYPNRDLVPFARNQSNDDVACWERGNLSRVVVIHDFATAGWEQKASFDTFWDWFRSAIEDFIEFEPC